MLKHLTSFTKSLSRNKTALLAMSTALFVSAPAVSVSAQEFVDNARYAAIVVDAQTGETLYDKRADVERYPASLTKIMTLYMAFEALAKGELKPTDTITMSRHANAQAPVKIGMREGDTITVDAAMRLAALYSANDLAVAIAEKIGGTEDRFAALMTVRAQEIGMTHSRFVNASGLPDSRQVSSAHDLAILARAVMRDYPQYYEYFNVRSYEFQGRTYLNHNPLLGMDGIDGMKTGYTGAAGYNLVASGVRGNHRLIAVMLGGSNKWQRREHVTALVDTGFSVVEGRDHGQVKSTLQTAFADELSRHYRPAPQPVPYSTLAQNNVGITHTINNENLRETLAASENANDTAGEDVERLSAKTRAPALAQALLTPTKALPARIAPTVTAPPKTDVTMAPIPNPAPATAALASAPANPAVTTLSNVAPVALASIQPPLSSKTPYVVPSTALQTRLTETTTKAADKNHNKSKANADPDAIWSIQVGAFKEKGLALVWLKRVKSRFSPLNHARTQVVRSDQGWFRSRFIAMTHTEARETCRKMDAHDLDCVVIKPD